MLSHTTLCQHEALHHQIVSKCPAFSAAAGLRALQPLGSLATTSALGHTRTNHNCQFEVNAVRFLEDIGSRSRRPAATATAAAPTKQQASAPQTPQMQGIGGMPSVPPSTPSGLHNYLLQCLQAGMEPSAAYCNQALIALCTSARWPHTWHGYQLARAAGAQLSYDTCLQLCLKAIEAKWITHAGLLWQAACETLKGPPDQRAYVTAISKLLKLSASRGVPNCQLAYKLWRELFEAYKTSLDGASIRAGVNTCSRIGRFEEAEKLLLWSRRIGVRAGHGAFNRLLVGYAARGDMLAAMRVFKALRQNSYDPDRYTWNTLIWGFAHNGDIKRAEAAMAQARLQGCPPDAQGWSSLLHGYARSGQMEKAEQSLQEMHQQQTQQTRQYQAELYRYHDALAQWRSRQGMNSSSSSGSSSSSMRSGQGGPPMPPQMPEPLVTAHAYGTLVDGYMRTANAAAAEEVVQRVRREGLPPSRIIYNTLVRGHCKLGVTGQARALELVREMRKVGLTPEVDTLTTLLQAAGDVLGLNSVGLQAGNRLQRSSSSSSSSSTSTSTGTSTSTSNSSNSTSSGGSTTRGSNSNPVQGSTSQQQQPNKTIMATSSNGAANANSTGATGSSGSVGKGGWELLVLEEAARAQQQQQQNPALVPPSVPSPQEQQQQQQPQQQQVQLSESEKDSSAAQDLQKEWAPPILPAQLAVQLQPPPPWRSDERSWQIPQASSEDQLRSPDVSPPHHLGAPLKAPPIPQSPSSSSSSIPSNSAQPLRPFSAPPPYSRQAPTNATPASASMASSSVPPPVLHRNASSSSSRNVSKQQQRPSQAGSGDGSSSSSSGSGVYEGNAAAYGAFLSIPALIANSNLAGRDELAALLVQLQKEGLAPDGALLTTLMTVAARQGEYNLALKVFDALVSNPHAATDTKAWNALAAVHASQGMMRDAELAAARATEVAASQGMGPPEESFLALIRGYGRAGDLRRVLAAIRRFMALGGRPKQRTLDAVVKLCLRQGDFTAAYKVLRAAELTGAAVNRERYSNWLGSWQRQRAQGSVGVQRQQKQQQQQQQQLQVAQQEQQGKEGGQDGDVSSGQSNEGLERIKWFLGLPNTYYSSD